MRRVVHEATFCFDPAFVVAAVASRIASRPLAAATEMQTPAPSVRVSAVPNSALATKQAYSLLGTARDATGRYLSKREFEEATFAKLGKVLPKGAQLRVINVIVAANMAVVELVSDATARNGMRFTIAG